MIPLWPSPFSPHDYYSFRTAYFFDDQRQTRKTLEKDPWLHMMTHTKRSKRAGKNWSFIQGLEFGLSYPS